MAVREWSKSLQPVLSKIWMCGVLIQTDGSQPTSLPTGIDGAHIKVGLGYDSASISKKWCSSLCAEPPLEEGGVVMA